MLPQMRPSATVLVMGGTAGAAPAGDVDTVAAALDAALARQGAVQQAQQHFALLPRLSEALAAGSVLPLEHRTAGREPTHPHPLGAYPAMSDAEDEARVAAAVAAARARGELGGDEPDLEAEGSDEGKRVGGSGLPPHVDNFVEEEQVESSADAYVPSAADAARLTSRRVPPPA